jgi:hypothetical protein
MGTSYSKSKNINNIANIIYNDTIRINKEFNHFIKNNIDENINHINGGVSSGIMSSEKFNAGDDIIIDIWYDISLMELLRGRYSLLEEFVKTLNQKKKNNKLTDLDLTKYHFSNQEQKDAYIRRYGYIKEDMTLDDLKHIIQIPNNVKYNKIGKYMYNKLKTLFNKHGFENHKEIIDSLVDLQKKPEGRCTSGLKTFLNVLKNKEKFLKSDPLKRFHVKLSLTSSKITHNEKYDEIAETLEKSIKNKIFKPIKFIVTDGMKDGDDIDISFEYYSNTSFGYTSIERFNYKLPLGFTYKHKIGDVITFSPNIENELPSKLYFKLYDIWYPEYLKEEEKIKKVSKLKESYDFSFDIDTNTDSDEFIKFVTDTINDFSNKSKEYNFNL